MSIYVPPRTVAVKAGPIGPGAGVLLTEYPLMSILGKDPHAKMRTAYQIGLSVPWIRASERLIGAKVATVDFDLDDPDEEEIDAKYPNADAVAALDLLERPQANLGIGQPLSRSSLWRLTSRHLGLAGNAFWLLDQPEAFSGTPAGIAYLRPDRLTPKDDANGNLLAWWIDRDLSRGKPGIEVSLEQIVHFMLEPPDSGHFGPGLVETALLKGQISNALDRHLANVISAGGRLSGFVSPKEGIMADEQRLALERDWRTITEQPDAAKRLQLIAAPVEFQHTTMTPAELEIVKLFDLARDDLLAFWNVPGSLIGVRIGAGLNSGDTRKFDEAALWQGPVHDRLVVLSEGIQDGILERWQKRIGWVPALVIEEPEFDDDTPLYENAERALGLPLKNIERREMIGREPFGDERDEEVWIRATQVEAYPEEPETPQPIMRVLPSESQTPAGEPTSDRALIAAGETTQGKAEPLTRSLTAIRDQMAAQNTPRIAASMRGFLGEQRRDIAARIRGRADHVASNPRDTSVWWDGRKWDTALRAVLIGGLAGMATAVSREVGNMLPAKASPLTPVDRVLERGAARVTKINDRTRDAIQEWLVTGIDEGLSPAALADEIERAVMENGQPIFDEYRAELIARTELMDAYNASALYSYDDAGITHVQAIDGDKDAECADRNGKEFSIEDADGIEDHPNGTLDWIPVLKGRLSVVQLLDAVKAEEEERSVTLTRTLSDTAKAMTAFAERKPDPVVVTPQMDVAVFAAALDRLTETIRAQPAPVVTVTVPDFPAIPAPIINYVPPATVRKVVRDKDGRVTEVREEPA